MALRKLAVSRVRACPIDPSIKCPLAGNGYVPGCGPEETEYAIVGEGPAFNEVRMGIPFVGPAGQVLNSALIQAEVDRNQVYVTNAVKCRFPAGLTSNEKKVCTERCSKDIVKELTSRGAKYVLAMGNIATGALGYSYTGITKSRGKVFEHPAGFKVMQCVHPAAILHGGAFIGPEVTRNLVKDIKGWAAECTDSRVEIFTNFDVIEDPKQGIVFLRDVAKRTRAVIDTETSGFSITFDGFICAVISLGPEHATILTDDVLYDEDFITAFQRLGSLYWIGHNLSFDLLRIRKWLGVELEPGFCTMLSHYCLNEERGTHGLKILAANLLDAPDWEADIKKHGDPKKSFLFLPKPVLWKYCANDGVFNYRLYEVLWERLNRPENEGPLRLYNTIMLPGIKALMDLEENGIYIDPERLQHLWREFEADAEKAANELRTLVKKSLRKELGPIYGPGYEKLEKKEREAFDRKIVRVRTEFNPNSTQQLGYVLYNRLKAPPYSQSGRLDAEAMQLVAPTGRVPEYSTRKEQLERLTRWHELPEVKGFAEALISYRGPKHSISHYLRPFSESVEDDGRVHPSYLLHSSVTGRLSSRDPNVMNMERDSGVRRAPTPEPGNVFIIPDYSQSEFRVMAMLSEDKVLQQYYRDGGDVHDMTTTWFYGPDYTDTHRVIGKGFNFGVLYGRGIKSIALGFGIPLYEAREKMDMLFEVMPGLTEFLAKIRYEVLTKGYIETPLGRRRRFPGATPQNYGSVQRFAVNSPIQGTSSDLLFLALMDILKWSPDYSTRVLFPLHDSLPTEAPMEPMREIALRMIRDMQKSPRTVFGPDCIPFTIDVLYGDSLHKNDLQKLEYTQQEVDALSP